MKKIHFIGIGGIGVSGLAGYYLSKGYSVAGSDLDKSPTIEALKKQGAKIYVGQHKAQNLAKDADLVIHTAAATADNFELKQAKRLGIKCQTYAQALGDLTKQMFTIAVSGMHGKSTTTAMLALAIEKAGLDPTVIVGTKVKEWGNLNYRVGKSLSTKLRAGKYLVIEADEYKASFLNYWPKILVLTNIEEEHLDYYKNLNHIMATFRKYVSHLGKDGILVVNGDDTNISKLFNSSRITRSEATGLKSQISKLHVKCQNYSTKQQEANKIRKILQVSGEHNVSNALAVLTVSRALRISDKITFKALNEFKGTWRRMEFRGMINGAKIYDDYGHHPTEIKATLEGAYQLLSLRGGHRRRPTKQSRASATGSFRFARDDVRGRLWLVFQPHQYQRTYKLFNQFITAFNNADKVVLLPIYSVPGRERDSIKKKISSQKLVHAIKNKYPVSNIQHIDSFKKAKNYLKKNLKKGDIAVIMGAGDIYKLTEMLLKKTTNN